MTRSLFTFATLLSLALTAATAVLWIRSYHRTDFLTLRPSPDYVIVSTDRGGIWVTRGGLWPDMGPAEYDKAWLGFETSAGYYNDMSLDSGAIYLSYRKSLRIPLWLPFLVFGGLTICGVRRIRRLTTECEGHRCHVCDYDLRASKDRCPECGTPIIVATGRDGIRT